MIVKEREREVIETSAHEVPRDGEDDGDDGNASHDMLLIAAVEVVLQSGLETSTSSSNLAFCVATHFHFLARFPAGSSDPLCSYMCNWNKIKLFHIYALIIYV